MPGRPWFVYVIECRNGSLYTGIAVDVPARYAAHLAGRGARYTRMHPPQRLLATLACRDRGEASRAEAAIKGWPVARKRAWLAAGCDASAWQREPACGSDAAAPVSDRRRTA